MDIRVLPCGERALLLEVDSLDEVLALRAAIDRNVLDARLVPTTSHRPDAPSRSVWAHVLDVVPAARTVLVTVDTNETVEPLKHELTDLAAPLTPADIPDPERIVKIPVVYDGPDLAAVAERVGISEQEVIDAHTGSEWVVAFGGFAPGFVYLTGGDPRLNVPRHPEPRTQVPDGAVGIAGEFSGVYPPGSPGGWQLLGHTDTLLWDLDREPPELLHVGYGVRFVQVDAHEQNDSHEKSEEGGA